MSAPLFEIRNLIHRYNGKTVLEEDYLTIEAGSITGLTGPNGSGKSTLIHILGLIIKPTQGIVRFMGTDVKPFSPESRLHIATLTQEAGLLKRTVFNNVAYGLKIRGEKTGIQESVETALHMAGLSLAEYGQRSFNELSGGEARRVALAARLALKPGVLLLDEPTAHVDEHSNRMIRKAVLTARNLWGTTLVIASHDREWLDSIADHELTLFKGRIFKEDRINIISGPWVRHDTPEQGNTWHKEPDSANATGFVIPEPPSPDATAVLSAAALILSTDTQAIPHGHVVLNARITGLFLNRNRNSLIATLNADGLPLVSVLTSPDLIMFKPGDPVLAHYSLGDILFR